MSAPLEISHRQEENNGDLWLWVRSPDPQLLDVMRTHILKAAGNSGVLMGDVFPDPDSNSTVKNYKPKQGWWRFGFTVYRRTRERYP